MTTDELTVPLIALGAAGAFTLATLLRPRSARAAPLASTTTPTTRATTTALPTTSSSRTSTATPTPSASRSTRLFEFGRPLPAEIRAVVSSGWLESRGDRLHRGLDIGAPTGTPILAIGDGVVTRAVRHPQALAGRWVAVKHPSGVTSRYLHLSRVLVSKGQEIRRGEAVGLCGETGNARTPHLHLDLRVAAAMLPAIERAIGKPRPGWGPEMRPFGVSIPGEPWVPVDEYTRSVRRDASEAGIPLYTPPSQRNGSLTYRPVGRRGEPYPDWLHRIRGESGVYVIRERDRDGDPVTVYVGESSSGRLYETLTRHLQGWHRWKNFWSGQYAEGHDPGMTYDRARVEVAVKVTSAADAIDEEARLIRRLRPRDNLLGQPAIAGEVPF